MTEPVVDAWHALPAGARRSLELAHESLLAGGLAVGAALTTANGDVVAAGRNRAYDPPTGVDPLEATPLAHAEMNALARLPTTTAAAELAIWSTEQPCAMCQAALDFIGIPVVRVIATDPSDRSRPARPALDDVWVVLATAMFLVGPLRRTGGRHPMVEANRVDEPEAVALAERIWATAEHPLVDGRSLADALAAAVDELGAIATSRRRRLANPSSAGGAGGR